MFLRTRMLFMLALVASSCGAQSTPALDPLTHPAPWWRVRSFVQAPVPTSDVAFEVARSETEARARGWTADPPIDFSREMLVRIGSSGRASAIATPSEWLENVDYHEVSWPAIRFPGCDVSSVSSVAGADLSGEDGVAIVRPMPAVLVLPRSERRVAVRFAWRELPCSEARRGGRDFASLYAVAQHPVLDPYAMEYGVVRDSSSLETFAGFPPRDVSVDLTENELVWIRDTTVSNPEELRVRTPFSARDRDVLIVTVPQVTQICVAKLPCTWDPNRAPDDQCLNDAVPDAPVERMDRLPASGLPFVRRTPPAPTDLLLRIPATPRELIVRTQAQEALDPRCVDPVRVRVYRSASEAASFGSRVQGSVDWRREMLLQIDDGTSPGEVRTPPLPPLRSGEVTVYPIPVPTTFAGGSECCDIPSHESRPPTVFPRWSDVVGLYRIPRSTGPVEVRWVVQRQP